MPVGDGKREYRESLSGDPPRAMDAATARQPVRGHHLLHQCLINESDSGHRVILPRAVRTGSTGPAAGLSWGGFQTTNITLPVIPISFRHIPAYSARGTGISPEDVKKAAGIWGDRIPPRVCEFLATGTRKPTVVTARPMGGIRATMPRP